MLQQHIATEQEKRKICCWRYPDEYVAYDLEDFDVLCARNAPFADLKRETYYRAWYIDGGVAAHTNLHERAEGVFVGIGVRPDLGTRGIGTQILRDACALVGQFWPAKTLFLIVRTLEHADNPLL